MADQPSTPDLTRMLNAWRDGDRDAADQLMQLVYPLLRNIARSRLRRTPGELTLQATELVSEAYARLAQGRQPEWQDRQHFFAVAARAIRNVVVDHQRSRDADKRGRNLPFVPLELAAEEKQDDAIDLRVDWLAVHEALNEFEQRDPHGARIVELKFFSGLTTDEIADVMKISRATVVRDWRFSRAWLVTKLGA
jgi:RNA polymerase sigma factor (TIGR02999 family)